MEWLRDTILNNRLYFSSPSSFNDPFDCKILPSFDGTSEQQRAHVEHLAELKFGSRTTDEARSMIDSALADPLFFDRGYASFQAQSVGELGVYCLSERFDDILMWSHYADAHRGICLILAASQMYADLSLEPVVYPADNAYPNINFFTSTMMQQAEAVLLTKAKHWEYEREWRVIDTTGNGWHEIQPEWLLGIIFGCETPPARMTEIRTLAQQRALSLKFFQARKKHREFALAIEPL